MVVDFSPKVSVVISMYNSSITIQETVESVLNQSFRDFEILVIDDCSEDESTYIVDEISKKDSRVILHKTHTNSGGPAEPRNIGIREAKGDYIAFLDSDDIWLPEKLQVQLGYLNENYS